VSALLFVVAAAVLCSGIVAALLFEIVVVLLTGLEVVRLLTDFVFALLLLTENLLLMALCCSLERHIPRSLSLHCKVLC